MRWQKSTNAFTSNGQMVRLFLSGTVIAYMYLLTVFLCFTTLDKTHAYTVS